jgi:beta-phosphoglucomutase-like phosphatase (HAD superfamily)
MPATDGYGAIWDMDGTLVDTAELHFQAWEAACRELGRDFSVPTSPPPSAAATR